MRDDGSCHLQAEQHALKLPASCKARNLTVHRFERVGKKLDFVSDKAKACFSSLLRSEDNIEINVKHENIVCVSKTSCYV